MTLLRIASGLSQKALRHWVTMVFVLTVENLKVLVGMQLSLLPLVESVESQKKIVTVPVEVARSEALLLLPPLLHIVLEVMLLPVLVLVVPISRRLTWIVR